MKIFGVDAGEVADEIEKLLGGHPGEKKPVKRKEVAGNNSVFTPRPQAGTTYTGGKVFDANGVEVPDVDETGFSDTTARRVH